MILCIYENRKKRRIIRVEEKKIKRRRIGRLDFFCAFFSFKKKIGATFLFLFLI
jgi:hypothetical protein